MKTNTFLILTVLAATVVVSGCMDSKQNKEDSKLQVPVGENAWGDEKTVNITKSGLTPSEVRLERTEMLVWKNKNEFNVTVSIDGVNKEFVISRGGRQGFKPSSDFNYRVSSENGRIGTGKVVVRSDS